MLAIDRAGAVIGINGIPVFNRQVFVLLLIEIGKLGCVPIPPVYHLCAANDYDEAHDKFVTS